MKRIAILSSLLGILISAQVYAMCTPVKLSNSALTGGCEDLAIRFTNSSAIPWARQLLGIW